MYLVMRFRYYGEMSERLMELVLKTSVLQGIVGSNPTLSAIICECDVIGRHRGLKIP